MDDTPPSVTLSSVKLTGHARSRLIERIAPLLPEDENVMQWARDCVVDAVENNAFSRRPASWASRNGYQQIKKIPRRYDVRFVRARDLRALLVVRPDKEQPGSYIVITVLTKH